MHKAPIAGCFKKIIKSIVRLSKNIKRAQNVDEFEKMLNLAPFENNDFMEIRTTFGEV